MAASQIWIIVATVERGFNTEVCLCQLACISGWAMYTRYRINTFLVFTFRGLKSCQPLHLHTSGRIQAYVSCYQVCNQKRILLDQIYLPKFSVLGELTRWFMHRICTLSDPKLRQSAVIVFELLYAIVGWINGHGYPCIVQLQELTWTI